jgi:TolB-like protein/Tfp pilus assembly protein PilF
VANKLQLEVLGGFQAQWEDGTRVRLPSKKAQALLAYLAVERGRPQSRETLATLLWGNTGEERARHNLRQAIAKIRQIHEPLLISSADCLELDAKTCSVDVVEFERLAAGDDAGDLRRSLDLYQGELLSGLNPREPGFEEWLRLARGKLKQLACRTARRLAERSRDNDRLEDSAAAWNDLLAIDPADEPAHRDLMTVLAALGRRSAALRQYRLCCEALERELGAEPGGDTKALFAGLQQSDPVEPAAVKKTTDISVGTHRPAIAVLPFENLCAQEDAYFVDGIAEDLITALSCSHSLVVIARGSSFNYRDPDVSERAIAEELGARYLVRGSVQRSANRVRINIRLLDTAAGVSVWGHRFDRELEDVFLLQDEITSMLVSNLPGQVEAAHLAHARRAPPERLDAYDLLLRGKEHHHRFTAADCAKCIELFRSAIEKDPSYALAYAWLACGLGQGIVFGLDETPKLVDGSQAAAEKGLELDENDSECHRILAQVSLARGNLGRALWHQERALAMNANDDRIVCAMGEILAFVGDAEQAEVWVRKSMRLNPFHPPRYWSHLARALFHQARFGDTLDALKHVGKARIDDLSYRIAASVEINDNAAADRAVAQLRAQFPDFDAAAFVTSMPYEREDYRNALFEPLNEKLSEAER